MKLAVSLATVVGLISFSRCAEAAENQIFVLNGQCTKLVIGGNDQSDKCIGKLESHTLANGRVGFTFTGGDIVTILFAGDGAQQVKLSEKSASQPLDRVTFTLLGMGGATKANPLLATGQCTYSDPFSGPSTITCDAVTANGKFSGVFQTDGAPPSILRQNSSAPAPRRAWFPVLQVSLHGEPMHDIAPGMVSKYTYATPLLCMENTRQHVRDMARAGIHGSYLCMYHNEPDAELRRAATERF